LAEVAVDPDYQRSGLGRRLVLEALEEGRKCGAQFALLFGTSPLYEATGFSAAPDNQIRIVNMRGAQTANVQNLSDHHLMVQALGAHSWDYTADIDLAGFPF